MHRPLHVFQNIGAEEGHSWRHNLQRPPVQALLRKWRRALGIPPLDLEKDKDPKEEQILEYPWLKGKEGLIPWLSTQEALAEATSCGRPLLASPPEIVKKVHDKAFAVHFLKKREAESVFNQCIQIMSPESLTDVEYATSLIDSAIEAWPAWLCSGFTLKPRFGTSGRGRVPGRQGYVTEDVKRGFSRLAKKGGAVLEPWLEKRGDYSAQFLVHDDGLIECLGATQQCVSNSGVYLGNSGYLLPDGRLTSGHPVEDEMISVGTDLVYAMAADGYRGPCGIDAMTYRGPQNETLFRPVIEVNARWTAGLVAFGQLYRDIREGKSGRSGKWTVLLGEEETCWKPRD